MRIAFVNDTFIEGNGVSTVIYELARRLGKIHDVFIIAPEIDMPEDNFKIIKIKGRKLLSSNSLNDSIQYFPNLIRLRKEILNLHKKYNFDIFNVHHSSLNPAFFSLPSVITWHGSPFSKNIFRVYLNKAILLTLRKKPVSLVISDYMKENLSKIIHRDKIKVVYNGVSEEFNPKKKDKKFMLFVGRLENHKSVHELIRLSKEINFPIYIVGSGPLEPKLKNYAKLINADKVSFLGKISKKELIKNYQECSFFISASKWEGFGLIFIEAAACRKPSIGYKRGSISEVILNEKTGFLVDNYDNLKEKAVLLINNKKLREKMGKEALRYSKKFSWENSAKEYEKIFKSISSA
ncbi:glycosyltransferase family 4 protein [Candidatus Pacearchaeota archaeon]|nr:glycosyltransferase family 4 protein [Candidatus Pacearchaeota archaeon]